MNKYIGWSKKIVIITCLFVLWDALSMQQVLHHMRTVTNRLRVIWNAFDSLHYKEILQQASGLEGIWKTAQVSGSLLAPDGTFDERKSKEAFFIKQRRAKAQNALKEFLNRSLLSFSANTSSYSLACAFSGGGYRAMIVTLGFLKALEDIQLLDATMYISTLSGSTWCLGPWIFLQKRGFPIVSFAYWKDRLIEKVHRGIIDPFALTRKIKTTDTDLMGSYIVWPKVVFAQPISSVDFYGALLADTVLSDFGARRYSVYLSRQLKRVQYGGVPWPIYTAVSMHEIGGNYLYNWYEFNPEEIRNLEINLGIPAFAFDMKFNNGKPIELALEQSFSFLMGIFGSAYAVSAQDIKRILYPEPDQAENKLKIPFIDRVKKTVQTLADTIRRGNISDLKRAARTHLEQVQEALVRKVVTILAETEINIPGARLSIGTKRVSPAQVHNPFKGYMQANQPWLQNQEYLTFVDAGLSYNIPLRPLFRPERNIGVILIGDASANALEKSKELESALNDIKRVWGITYNKDNSVYTQQNKYGFVSRSVVSVYRPNRNTYARVPFIAVKTPVIIRFTFAKDLQLLRNASKNSALKQLIEQNKLYAFDPIACLKKECSTYNFDYSVDDIVQLSGLMEFNVKAHEQLIAQLIREHLNL